MKKTFYSFLLFIYCSVAHTQTITWSPAQNVASSSYENLHPRVVTDRSGDPMVIWGRMSDESVFFSKWNGASFTTPVKINTMGMTVATQGWMGPDIASKGDTVYVVMKKTPETSNTNHIYISRSFNGGTTFSMPVQVEYIADSLSRFPVVTTDDLGNPLVGYMKFNSAFGEPRWVVTRSTNYGSTFFTDEKASGWSGAGAAVCDCCPGSLVCSGNNVAMLYRDNLSNIRDMWAGISTNTGSAFLQGYSYDQGNWFLMNCPSSGPDGTIIGDTLYTTYMSAATGDELIYHNKTSLSSLANSPGTLTTGMFTGLTQQNYPRIASGGKALATVWKQAVSGTDYLVTSFTNNIESGSFDLDTIAYNSVTNGDVALINGKIFAVWQDYNTGTVKYRMGTFNSVTGIKESSEEQFSLYPNPVSNQVNIRLSSTISSGKIKLQIINALGENVLTLVRENNSDLTLDTKSLANGLYLITLQSPSGYSAKRMIIENK